MASRFFQPSRRLRTTSSTSVPSLGCDRHENLSFTSMGRNRPWRRVRETARSQWSWPTDRILAVQRAAVSALATVADAVGDARACHDAAERIFRAMSEDDVARVVNSPFGNLSSLAISRVRLRRALAPSRAAVHVSAVAQQGAADALRLSVTISNKTTGARDRTSVSTRSRGWACVVLRRGRFDS